MNEAIEKELRQAPDDWSATVLTVRQSSETLKQWLSGSDFEQFILVGDQDTEALAQWAARTFGLISQGIIWGTSENSLLTADAPPTATQGNTLVVFLNRRGGDASSVKVSRKMDQWYSRNRKVALLSTRGLLQSAVDHSITLGKAEITAIPTVTPTRLMVALMTLGAIITGKDVLTKRAELLSQWYVPTPAATLAKMMKDAPDKVRVAAPKRLFSHCLAIKSLVEADTGQTSEMLDLDSAEEVENDCIILGVTAKSSEDQDLRNLVKLQGENSRVVAFSSKAPSPQIAHLSLSRRTTDIGRTIHTLLNVQKLLLCRRVQKSLVPC